MASFAKVGVGGTAIRVAMEIGVAQTQIRGVTYGALQSKISSPWATASYSSSAGKKPDGTAPQLNPRLI
jgi:hypothetical protein